MELSFNPYKPDLLAFLNKEICFYKLQKNEYNKTVKEYNEDLGKVSPFQSINFGVPTKCFCWRPTSSDVGDVVALGLENGEVLMKTISEDSVSQYFSQSVNSKSTNHKQTKSHPSVTHPCTSLSWNQKNSNRIAAGFEKFDRSNKLSSLLIWDINLIESSFDIKGIATLKGSSNSPRFGLSDVTTQPMSLANDSVTSLSWLQSDALITGFRNKGVKIYDIRSGKTPVNSTVSNIATYGICCDPFSDTRIASYHDETIVIWDSRNFSTPYLSIITPGQITKITWSPDSCGQLAVCRAASAVDVGPALNQQLVPRTCVYVYDVIRQVMYNNGQSQTSPCNLFKKTVRVPKENIETLSWFPGNLNKLLVCDDVSNFCTATVPERLLASFQSGKTVGTFCRNIVSIYDCSTAEHLYIEGVCYADLMKKRAKTGYALQRENIIKNVELSLESGNLPLKSIWLWIHRVYEINKLNTQKLKHIQKSKSQLFSKKSANIQQSPSTGSLPPGSNDFVPLKGLFGCFQLLNCNEEKTSLRKVEWKGAKGNFGTIYQSPTRRLILQMCGWLKITDDIEEEIGFESMMTHLRETNAPNPATTSRLASIALWNFNLTSAIEVLQDDGISKSPNWSTVAMAMSGFDGLKSSQLWKETCSNLKWTIQDSYLCAAFWFLLMSAKKRKNQKEIEYFKEILFNEDLLLSDRIGFACLHLSSDSLISFFKQLRFKSISNPSLDLLVITGLHDDVTIKILEDYLEKNLDYQTVLGIILLSQNPSLLQSSKSQHWKERYTTLLNSWQFYFERINFDKTWSQTLNNLKPTSPSHVIAYMTSSSNNQAVVMVHCNFCAKPITAKERPAFSYRDAFRDAVTSSMITSCPNCRRPLPRCCVCSKYVGCRPEDRDIRNWLAVCASCRHGGHYEHMSEWFKTHLKCPVSDCKCSCDAFNAPPFINIAK